MKKINIYKEIILIISLSIFFAFIRYCFIYNEFDLIKVKVNNSEDCVNSIDVASNSSEPRCITSELAEYMFSNDLGLFIDARYEDSYNSEHIVGAVNLSYEEHALELDIDYIKESILYNEVECDHSFCIGADNSVPYIAPNVANSKKYDYYIIYCDGEGCPYSYDLSIFLFENFNINNIFYYEEGMPVWKEKGLPTK